MTAAVLLAAAHLVYDRPALRLDMVTQATAELLIVLLGVVGLTLAATFVAVARGEHGLGARVTSLFLAAVLVTPIYSRSSWPRSP